MKPSLGIILEITSLIAIILLSILIILSPKETLPEILFGVILGVTLRSAIFDLIYNKDKNHDERRTP